MTQQTGIRAALAVFGLLALLFAPGMAAQAQDATPAASACNPARTAAVIGQSAGELDFGGQPRDYVLYVPASYDPAVPAVLIISLHGFASWPENQMSTSQWNDLADETGAVIVYPAGTGVPLRWNAGGGFDNPAEPVDDVAFIGVLIDHLLEQLCLDPARVYVNGLSNGGGMSYLLACRMAERIAAIGTVAGAYLEPEDGCNPARPVPVIAFHGTADLIVPYAGGGAMGFDFPPVPEWTAAWAARNGCALSPETASVSDSVSSTRYTDCDADAEVILYTIDGGGHSWPGGAPLPAFIVGSTSEEIDASALMWAFYMQHPAAQHPLP